MRHLCLGGLLSVILTLAFCEMAALAQGVPDAGLGRYPLSPSVAAPGAQPTPVADQWPPPLPPRPTKHHPVPLDPSMKAYPYGYFGAVPRYRANSHYTSSGEYMFWQFKRH
jgi:hypothetical protein